MNIPSDSIHSKFELFILKPYNLPSSKVAKVALTTLSILFEIITIGIPFFVVMGRLKKQNQQDDRIAQIVQNNLPQKEEQSLPKEVRKDLYDSLKLEDLYKTIPLELKDTKEISPGDYHLVDTNYSSIKIILAKREDTDGFAPLLIRESESKPSYYYLLRKEKGQKEKGQYVQSKLRFTKAQLSLIARIHDGEIDEHKRLSGLNAHPKALEIGMPILTDKQDGPDKKYYMIDEKGILFSIPVEEILKFLGITSDR